MYKCQKCGSRKVYKRILPLGGTKFRCLECGAQDRYYNSSDFEE